MKFIWLYLGRCTPISIFFVLPNKNRGIVTWTSYRSFSLDQLEILHFYLISFLFNFNFFTFDIFKILILILYFIIINYFLEYLPVCYNIVHLTSKKKGVLSGSLIMSMGKYFESNKMDGYIWYFAHQNI